MSYYSRFEVLMRHPGFCKIRTSIGLSGLAFLLLVRLTDMRWLACGRWFVALRLRIISGSMRRRFHLAGVCIRSFL